MRGVWQFSAMLGELPLTLIDEQVREVRTYVRTYTSRCISVACNAAERSASLHTTTRARVLLFWLRGGDQAKDGVLASLHIHHDTRVTVVVVLMVRDARATTRR